MNNVTQILTQLEAGDPQAAERLLPLVYDELRGIAAARLAHEQPGQTTALVHEAYLRLVEVNEPQNWNPRGHFFASMAGAGLATCHAAYHSIDHVGPTPTLRRWQLRTTSS